MNRRREIHYQINDLLQLAKDTSQEIEKEDKELCDAGRQACVELCEKLHSKLPKELRDMVYDEIIGAPGEKETVRWPGRRQQSNWYLSVKGIIYDNEGPKSQEMSDRSDLRWWCNDYMSKAIAHEIVMRWYTTRKFYIRGS